MKGYELSDNYVNLFNVITCSLHYYHININLLMFDFIFYYFFVKFIFTFTFDGKFICCKLFSENELLTYLLLQRIDNIFDGQKGCSASFRQIWCKRQRIPTIFWDRRQCCLAEGLCTASIKKLLTNTYFANIKMRLRTHKMYT